MGKLEQLRLRSKFCTALFVFWLGGLLALLVVKTDVMSVFSWQPKTEEWWTVKSYLDRQAAPTVVLFGSSLMTQISNEGDATALNQTFDRRFHNRSVYFERLVDKLFSRRISVASLSIPGSHCSDVAMLSECLLRPPRQPELVIFGIAPRDLMDNSLSAPFSTTTFHLMEKLRPPSKIVDAGNPHWQDKLTFATNSLLGQFFPSYLFQEELSLQWRRMLRQQIDGFLPASEFLSTAQKTELGLKMGRDDCTTPQYSFPAATPETISDLSNCYRSAYNPFKQNEYNTQLKYFQCFLNTCKSRGVRVLVVNMPLRRDSFALMPPGFYDKYLDDVLSLSTECGASFANFNNDQRFQYDDFIDQVHLSGRAAPKFLAKVVDYLPLCLAGCNATAPKAIGMTNKASIHSL